MKSGVFFQALNTPKLVFQPGLHPGPRWGSLWHSPDPLVGWGGGHPVPFPQLLQPQLLNNWPSGRTLFSLIWNNDCWVDHIGKHLIPGNLCLPLLEKAGNFMWSGKWSPCPYWQKTQSMCYTATMRICLHDFATVRHVVLEFITYTRAVLSE